MFRVQGQFGVRGLGGVEGWRLKDAKVEARKAKEEPRTRL